MSIADFIQSSRNCLPRSEDAVVPVAFTRCAVCMALDAMPSARPGFPPALAPARARRQALPLG